MKLQESRTIQLNTSQGDSHFGIGLYLFLGFVFAVSFSPACYLKRPSESWHFIYGKYLSITRLEKLMGALTLPLFKSTPKPKKLWQRVRSESTPSNRSLSTRTAHARLEARTPSVASPMHRDFPSGQAALRPSQDQPHLELELADCFRHAFGHSVSV